MSKDVAKLDAPFQISALKPKSKARRAAEFLAGIGAWEALLGASHVTEEWLSNLFESAEESGVELDDPSVDRKKKEQVLAVELAKKPETIDVSQVFRGKQHLVKAYHRMRDAFGMADVDPVDDAAHDAAQVASVQKSQLSDKERQLYLRDMARCCNHLGLTGAQRFRDLYEIAQIINSIRKVNVDDAEAHEKIFGTIRS